MTPEQWAQGIGIGFAVVIAMAAAFWWGYEVRGRLAVKVEFWNITNREWHEYDVHLKVNGHPPKKGTLLHIAGSKISGANE